MGTTQFFSTSFEDSKIDLDNEEELIEHFTNDVLPKVCEYEDVLPRQGPKASPEIQKKEFYAIITFELPIISTPLGSLIIGSKLDADISSKNC